MILPRDICFGLSALHRFLKHTWGDASLAPDKTTDTIRFSIMIDFFKQPHLFLMKSQ